MCSSSDKTINISIIMNEKYVSLILKLTSNLNTFYLELFLENILSAIIL
jgi:hypothetical protein